MRIELEANENRVVNLKVIGIGGGGNNVVNRMIKLNATDVDYIAVNTDKQQLRALDASTKIQIGEKLTRGLGAGADPEVGRKSAEETRNELAQSLEHTDMLFITAGLGGGTGTGAAPVIADIAREMGILTVAVVTKPFRFEGMRRMEQAERGIEELFARVDALVVIPNENLKKVTEQSITLANAFAIADDVLQQAVQSIADIIKLPGLINLDFADVSSVMKDAGYAHMGVGSGKGKTKAEDAAKTAIASPLLESSIKGAMGVLVNVTGPSDLGMEEVDLALTMVSDAVHPRANVIIGALHDESMDDEMRITVIATGFEKSAITTMPESESFTQKAITMQPSQSTNSASGGVPIGLQPNFDGNATPPIVPPPPTPADTANAIVDLFNNDKTAPSGTIFTPAFAEPTKATPSAEEEPEKFLQDIQSLFGSGNNDDL